MAYKYFKSKIGMFLSGIYLFVCCVLCFGGAISDANAIGFVSGLLLLTAPWSFWFSTAFYYSGGDFHGVFYLIIVAGVLLNAILLYFVGSLLTHVIEFLKVILKQHRSSKTENRGPALNQ